MNTSSRFTVAIHILVMLDLARRLDAGPVKSENIAGSVDTNPVVIRRVVGQLRKAGLVRSQPGPSGGTELCVDAREVKLSVVHSAVEAGDLFRLHYGHPPADCPVGGNIQHALSAVYSTAHDAMASSLARHRLADITDRTLSEAGIDISDTHAVAAVLSVA